MSKASGKTVPPRRPYVTLADVARRAGVHITTVSLALRGNPVISEATRERVRLVAEKIGYRRDPQLDAFNFHRARQHKPVRSHLSAFIVHSESSRLFAGVPYNTEVWEGAKAAAEAHGHSLEMFILGPGALAPARLNSILRARGANGVILSTFELDIEQLDLDWNRLAAVKIECLHLKPHLDCVTNDQMQVARLAMQRLRALGYRRIGLATSKDDDLRLAESFRSGVLIEQASLAEGECVPPLVFERADPFVVVEQIRDWVKTERADAVITNWPFLLPAFPKRGIKIPGDFAVAALDVVPGLEKAAAVVQNHRLVGQRAMEQLAMLTEANHNGVPETQTITAIPGYWRDGETAPPRVRG